MAALNLGQPVTGREVQRRAAPARFGGQAMTYENERARRRPGFTLVEMMVAMALILFIMVILSEAFVAGLESFRKLKAIGDMEERLRTAATQIRRDLSADHFEGRRRLSDPNFWTTGQPREGFFRIVQGQASYNEGQDADGNVSYRAYGPPFEDHSLHFTVKLRGNKQESFFSVSLPSDSPLLPSSPNFVPTNFFGQNLDGLFQPAPFSSSTTGAYNSSWAEVRYFLLPTGQSAGQTPLHALYRAQLVVVPDTRGLNYPANPVPGILPVPSSKLAQYQEVSCRDLGNGTISFHNPTDLANQIRALPELGNPQRGATLLLTDVISLDVQILRYNWHTGLFAPDFQDLDPGQAFDTFLGGGSNPPFPVFNLAAIQISLRVWDSKTEQARQITIIQDM